MEILEKKNYTHPEEAYKVLNDWLGVQQNFEARFHNKEITYITITLEDDRPILASFTHKSKNLSGSKGYEYMQFKDWELLDKPRSEGGKPKSTLFTRIRYIGRKLHEKLKDIY